MTQRLQTASRAARAAGRVLRAKFDAAREIRSKGKRDIVTDADYAAERAAREVLLARFPDDRFLSEESDARERAALWAEAEASDAVALWVVDPLDGTTNYAHHQPVFGVSIGLYVRHAVQLGVVYDPVHDELFAAERGHGATVNGRRMAVSTTRVLDDAVIGMDWARAQPVRTRVAHAVARMIQRVMTLRSCGSAALSLCYIAAGRLDAYFHLSLSPWDVAAGGLMVEEAGGKVTTPAGAPWSVHSQAYVASNGHLHRAMLRYLKER